MSFNLKYSKIADFPSILNPSKYLCASASSSIAFVAGAAADGSEEDASILLHCAHCIGYPIVEVNTLHVLQFGLDAFANAGAGAKEAPMDAA